MKKYFATILTCLWCWLSAAPGPPPQAPVQWPFQNTDYFQIYDAAMLPLGPSYPPDAPVIWPFRNSDLFQIYNALYQLDSLIATLNGGSGQDSLYVQTNRFGSTVLPPNTGPNTETWVGYTAGAYGESLNQTISIGVGAGNYDTSAYSSICIGNNAGESATGANNSIFIGDSVGKGASAATQSIFMGSETGNQATNASSAVFIGQGAGGNATNAQNSVFLGTSAGGGATDAQFSNAIGQNAGRNDTAARYCNFFGYNTGWLAYNVGESNFIGAQSGVEASNASKSEFIGYATGAGARNAANSIFIGYGAGYLDSVDNVNGRPGSYHSILIGDSTNTGGYINSIALGTNARNTAINQFLIAPQYTMNIAAFTGQGTQILSSDNLGNVVENPLNSLAWTLTGNTGTNPSLNLVGTTDGQPLGVQSGFNLGSGTQRVSDAVFIVDTGNGGGLFARSVDSTSNADNHINTGIFSDGNGVSLTGFTFGDTFQKYKFYITNTGTDDSACFTFLGDNAVIAIRHDSVNVAQPLIVTGPSPMVRIADGTQGVNKVLTSDGYGNASWQTPTGGGGGAKYPQVVYSYADTGLSGGFEEHNIGTGAYPNETWRLSIYIVVHSGTTTGMTGFLQYMSSDSSIIPYTPNPNSGTPITTTGVYYFTDITFRNINAEAISWGVTGSSIGTLKYDMFTALEDMGY